MLNHPTLDLMQTLGFDGMIKGIKDLQNNPESQALDHLEWLGLLLDWEAASRQQKRFERRLRTAKLRQAASVEDVEDRYDLGSILITSQLPLENWHDIIGDPTIADAILDRIVHNAHRTELKGESLRKTRDQTNQA